MQTHILADLGAMITVPAGGGVSYAATPDVSTAGHAAPACRRRGVAVFGGE